MKQKLFFLFLTISLLFSGNSYCQQTVQELNIKLSKYWIGGSKRLVMPIKSNNHYVGLFLSDEDSLKCFLLDSALKTEKSFSVKKTFNDFPNHIGNLASDNGYSMFFMDDFNQSLYSNTVSFKENGNVTNTTFPLFYGKEKYILPIQGKESLFLLSVNKQLKEFYIYEFKNGKEFKKEVFSFDFIKQSHPLFIDMLLSELKKSIFVEQLSQVSLNISHIPVKFYFYEGDIYLTDNTVSDRTFFLKFDLKQNKLLFNEIKQLGIDYDLKRAYALEPGKGNSYFYKGNLFQARAGYEYLSLQIINIQDQKILKEFKFSKKDSINIKNGPIKQEGGNSIYSPEERELDKTSQLIRKINNGEMAVCVNNNDEGIIKISIGSYKEFSSSGGAPMMMGGFNTTFNTPGGMVTIPSTNYTYFNYSTNKHKKSAYFNSLMAEDSFIHINSKEIAKSVFDQIDDYKERLGADIDTKTDAETVFKYNNGCIYGYYNVTEKKYLLTFFKGKS